MCIMSRIEGREWAEISNDEIVVATGMKQPNISASAHELVDRNILIIKREKEGNKYKINYHYEEWRSKLGISVTPGATLELKALFDTWYSRYPNPMYPEDTYNLWLELVNNGTSPQELEEALTGLIRHRLYMDERFKKNPDPLMCPFSSSFLRGSKWKSYVKHKDLKKVVRL